MKLVSQKEEAVSPVIGTILLIAITVVLVAIIVAVVMPMVSGAAVVSVRVVPEEVGTGVTITFTGGDYAKITLLNVLNNSGAEKTVTVGKYPVKLGVSYESIKVSTTAGTEDVKVVATINGNDQIIWQGKLTFNA